MAARRVCIVTPDLAGPTRNGGIGTHCLYLARFLARRGDDVTIVHTGPPDDTDPATWKAIYRDQHGAALLFLDEIAENLPVPVLPQTPRHTIAHRVDRWLRAQTFAEIHFQDWQGNGAIAARAKHAGAAYQDTRLVVTAHGSSEWIRDGMHEFPVEGRESLIDDALERAAVECADTLVCPSRHMHGWLQSHDWCVPGDTRVIPYLFETPGGATESRALQPGALKEIIFFGRLETRKGLEPFLAALEKIAASSFAANATPLQVHLVGKPHTTLHGPALERVARVQQACGPRLQIKLHDGLDHAGALEFLRRHRDALVVMPSLADNLPFAVIECVTLGLPLLAGNRGGIPELVGSPAHLVEPTAKALADRIGAVLADGLPALVPAYSSDEALAGWESLTATPPPPKPAPETPLRVSVCVPHFNQPAGLAAVLESLEHQTLTPHEVIVVDDGSDAAHRDKWTTSKRRFGARGWRFLEQPNQGPSTARNTAAAHASGDVLLFCDADNRPHPDMLEHLETALRRSEADIATCGFAAHKVDAETTWPEQPDYLFCPLGGAIELAVLENFIGDVNFAIRRDAFAKLGGFDTENTDASEDWQLLLKAALAGHRIEALPDPVFDYRIAPSSHARRHTPRSGAEAAWRSLPAEERSRYLRLLRAARGTFEERPLHVTSVAEIEATHQHARNLEAALSTAHERAAAQEQLVSLTRAELESATQHADNLSAILEVERRRERDQAKRLENRETELAATRQHAANLQGMVDSAEARIAQIADEREALREQEKHLQAQLRAEQARTLSLEQAIEQLDADRQKLTLEKQELNNEIGFLRERSRELDAQRMQLATELGRRTAKVERMQASVSWRVTQPLRALRRLLLDPFRSTSKHNAPGKPPSESDQARPRSDVSPPPATPGFLSVLDAPTQWTDLRVRLISVEGWIVRPDQRQITGVRVRQSDAVFEAVEIVVRHDVAAAFPGHPHALRAGFRVAVRADGESGEFVFEARTHDTPWEPFRTAAFTVAPGAIERQPSPYEAWIAANEDFAESAQAERRRRSTNWTRRPCISILMPVYNTPPDLLRRAIESVRHQSYENWELCIADDASTVEQVPSLLSEFSDQDSRIKVCRRPENGHISAASNSALELATGSWVALLDHDDELAPHALHEMVSAMQVAPRARFFYSDEDKIDQHGRRYAPYFKSDWQPELIHAQNFPCHLSIYPTALVREVGGFRRGFEGSQDWDLILRVIERLDENEIVHVPQVLYHWRAIPGSTAVEVTEKNYSVDSARRALIDHFARIGKLVEVLPVPGHNWRIKWPLPEPAPHVTIIIPTRDGLDYLKRCVESLLALTAYPSFEIVIVDNQSSEDATLDWFRNIRDPRARVLPFPHPFNYSAINNFAARQTSGEVLAFLNNDLEALGAGWLEEMVSQAVRPEIGCVGAQLFYPDGRVQHAGVVLGVGGVANHAFLRFPRGSDGYFNRLRLVQNYSAVTGACLVVRRNVFEQVGGFNEVDLPVAFNDVDFCLRVRQEGYRNLWTPHAEFIHHESATRGTDESPEKRARFVSEVEYMRRRWGALLDDDPAYSPNLSLAYPDFSIASPPRPLRDSAVPRCQTEPIQTGAHPGSARQVPAEETP